MKQLFHFLVSCFEIWNKNQNSPDSVSKRWNKNQVFSGLVSKQWNKNQVFLNLVSKQWNKKHVFSRSCFESVKQESTISESCFETVKQESTFLNPCFETKQWSNCFIVSLPISGKNPLLTKIDFILLFSGDFSYHYIWWFGSVLGAVQCAVIYRTFFAQEEYLFPFIKNLYQQ